MNAAGTEVMAEGIKQLGYKEIFFYNKENEIPETDKLSNNAVGFITAIGYSE
jgi:hypothetical protein